MCESSLDAPDGTPELVHDTQVLVMRILFESNVCRRAPLSGVRRPAIYNPIDTTTKVPTRYRYSSRAAVLYQYASKADQVKMVVDYLLDLQRCGTAGWMVVVLLLTPALLLARKIITPPP